MAGTGADQHSVSLAFIATARAEDDEMRERIRRHREERGEEFTTFEEPLDVASRILEEQDHFNTFVVDCATLWLSNHLLAGGMDMAQKRRQLIETAAAARARVLLVTNEVGCGIVPENALARQFRDLAGTLNQDAAAAAVEVYWMVFGIPLRVK